MRPVPPVPVPAPAPAALALPPSLPVPVRPAVASGGRSVVTTPVSGRPRDTLAVIPPPASVAVHVPVPLAPGAVTSTLTFTCALGLPGVLVVVVVTPVCLGAWRPAPASTASPCRSGCCVPTSGCVQPLVGAPAAGADVPAR